MSAAPQAPTGGPHAPAAKPIQTSQGCWSCRVISGCGLIFSGIFVGMGARETMKRCAGVSFGTVGQITFAASLAAWGVIIMAHPLGKSPKKI